MPVVRINGIEVEVPPGTNMIEAARRVGVEIPHYCYHPHLPVAGNCRMCLVDVEAGGRGPDIACNMVARDGLAIRTDTEQVARMRRSVMEFLLKNHPLDCPICDQSGECRLQDYYMEHARHDSRLADPKVTKGKRLDIADHVLLDQERCIACSRCVRFGDHVTGTGELRLFQRTDGTEIGVFPGTRIRHAYQGNLADICPVGALTLKAFRFRKRVWYLREVDAICGGCATGCNIRICHQDGEIFRVLPRRNDAVNKSWMCDPGRFSWERLRGPDRLLAARVEGRPARIDEGVAQAARELRDGRVGVVLGARATTEANAVLLALVDRHLPGARVFLVPGNDPDQPQPVDDFLMDADKNPNLRGAALVLEGREGVGDGAALAAALDAGELDVLLVLQDDVLSRIDRRAPGSLVYLGTWRNRTSEAAHVVVPLAAPFEQQGTWINRDGRVQRHDGGLVPPGEARPDLQALDLLAGCLGASVAPTSAPEVFADLARRHAALEGLTWDALGREGAPLRQPAAAK